MRLFHKNSKIAAEWKNRKARHIKECIKNKFSDFHFDRLWSNILFSKLPWFSNFFVFYGQNAKMENGLFSFLLSFFPIFFFFFFFWCTLAVQVIVLQYEAWKKWKSVRPARNSSKAYTLLLTRSPVPLLTMHDKGQQPENFFQIIWKAVEGKSLRKLNRVQVLFSVWKAVEDKFDVAAIVL